MPALALLGQLWIVIAPLAAVDDALAAGMLDKLAAEATELQVNQPEKWQQYENDAGAVFAENERRTAGWKKRSAPPRPDLVPLKLPLAFLVDRLLREPPPITDNKESTLEEQRLLRAQRDGHLRHEAYFTAIVHSDDERRIAAMAGRIA
ncbi:MAG TPA: hypothetical protein VFI31_08870 [Pirellulales bacterium]|nr:hypothetical protein [Pirellulales bacterium]